MILFTFMVAVFNVLNLYISTDYLIYCGYRTNFNRNNLCTVFYFTYELVQNAQQTGSVKILTKIQPEILLKKPTLPLLTFFTAYFKLYLIKLFGETRLFPYRVYENI